MENVSTDIESVKGFWRNPLTRILLVVIFAGLGSALGRVLALGKIFNDFFVGFGG
jgi:pheromone shutdown protein TraB